jgi:hypothetical protein
VVFFSERTGSLLRKALSSRIGTLSELDLSRGKSHVGYRISRQLKRDIDGVFPATIRSTRESLRRQDGDFDAQ